MTADPIRNKKDIKRLAEYFLRKGHLRNYALVILNIYTALRISDALALTWRDVYDFDHNKFRSHIDVKEKKTGKAKRVALNKDVCRALLLYMDALSELNPGSYIFASRNGLNKPICRSQAWRIMKKAASDLGLEGHISTHSLRKTLGYRAWKEKKASPVVIMKLYNHSSFTMTMRYLGITQDDLDEVYLSLSLLG
jgi:integrase